MVDTPLLVESLGVAFDSHRVLSDISFSVPRGETLVVLGKNGSGKSVLLKAVAGLLDSFEGSVEIDGMPQHEFFKGRGQLGDPRGADLAYVFQKGGLFDSMNVFDNVAFGLRRMLTPEEEVREKVTASLARVGLAGNDEKLPSELSGGMQKRVGLARAVSMEPKIILYDDPTAGLDPVLSDSIADLIIEIGDTLHTTSLVVTHDLKVARKVGDAMALLYGGTFVYYGTGDEFFNAANEYARQFIEGDIEGPIDIY